GAETGNAPDRAGLEAARLTGIVARLMERYRRGLLALALLRDDPEAADAERIGAVARSSGAVPDAIDRPAMSPPTPDVSHPGPSKRRAAGPRPPGGRLAPPPGRGAPPPARAAPAASPPWPMAAAASMAARAPVRGRRPGGRRRPARICAMAAIRASWWRCAPP